MCVKGALWPSGLERRTGGRVVLGSNPAGDTSVCNPFQFRFPASFRGDTKCRWSLLSGVYARGRKISHTVGKCVTCRGLDILAYINNSCVRLFGVYIPKTCM